MYLISLGGIGFILAEALERFTNIEACTVVIGYIQPEGTPSPFDRILEIQLGSKSIDLIEEQNFGYMIGVKRTDFIKVALKKWQKAPG